LDIRETGKKIKRKGGGGGFGKSSLQQIEEKNQEFEMQRGNEDDQ
jgi:hypothetical protein